MVPRDNGWGRISRGDMYYNSSWEGKSFKRVSEVDQGLLRGLGRNWEGLLKHWRGLRKINHWEMILCDTLAKSRFWWKRLRNFSKGGKLSSF